MLHLHLVPRGDAACGSALLVALLALLPTASSRAEDASAELTAADTDHDDKAVLAPEQAGAPKPALPERLLAVEVASPLDGFDANTAFWLSESELAGRAVDWLGLRAGLDRSPVGRAALTVGTLWLTVDSSYTSHEIAHDFVRRRYLLGTGPSLDFAHPWNALWPAYDGGHAGIPYGWEAACLSLVSGLNQNQWLARDAWRVVALRGQRNTQEAATYLVWKLANLTYIAVVGLRDGRPLGRRLSPVAVENYASNHDLWNDIDMYVLYMYSRGISVSKRGYLVQTTAADLLSFHTWESFWGGLRYLARGERQGPIATLSLGRGVRITPPLITAYATSEGTFYDITSVLNPGRPRQWLLSIGTDAAIVRGSALRRVRIGGQYQGIHWTSLSAAPFVYLDLNRGTARQGIDIGTDFRWRLNRSVSLAASLKYTDRDVIENTVKAVQVPDQGFKAIFGVRAVY
jgi:hypothetical protein